METVKLFKFFELDEDVQTKTIIDRRDYLNRTVVDLVADSLNDSTLDFLAAFGIEGDSKIFIDKNYEEFTVSEDFDYNIDDFDESAMLAVSEEWVKKAYFPQLFCDGFIIDAHELLKKGEKGLDVVTGGLKEMVYIANKFLKKFCTDNTYTKDVLSANRNEFGVICPEDFDYWTITGYPVPAIETYPDIL